MGIFDFFNKKRQEVAADNELEILLQKSATDPAYRAEFYKKLLTGNLYVLTNKEHLSTGKSIAQPGTNISIVNFNDGRIPVFTSPGRIFDKGVIKEQVKHLILKGEDLFTLTKGACLILNPYSDYGKELLPEEIEKMLDGAIFNGVGGWIITIKEEKKCKIGSPANYPAEIINALKDLFAQEPDMQTAYVAWIQFEGLSELPHYIFGLDTTGSYQHISLKTGLLVQRFLKANEVFDIVPIQNHSLSDYFIKNVTPFYKKQ
jgi:SseB protein C-terminal domain/SseB protein N-terminal domain